MKKQTYYCGFFRGRPHTICISHDHGDVLLAELFRKKSDAIKVGYGDVRRVKISEEK